MKKRILIVGTSFSGLTDYLRSRDYDYIVLKDQRTTQQPNKKLKHRVVCDFRNRETILNTVDGIGQSFDGVMTLYENYVLPTAWITEHLGLQGMSETAALACTDKFLMRQAFAQYAPDISPDFALATDEEAIRAFADTHHFPLILKPANLVKSLLVTKSNSPDELLHNYQETAALIDTVYQKYAPDRAPTVIVEEYLQGSMHSVAAFADRAGVPHVIDQIVDLQRASDVGYDDNFLYSRTLPSQLSEADQEAIRTCAARGIQALGMKNSPAHVEIILTPKGPRIVEIGARNGGYRERMYRLSSGIDLVGAAAEIALGNIPNLTSNKEDACAVIELFPETQGTFDSISNSNIITELPSCVYFNIKATKSTIVGKAADGYKRCAIIILYNADREQLRNDLEIIKSNVRVELQ